MRRRGTLLRDRAAVLTLASEAGSERVDRNRLAADMARQIATLDIDDPDQCLRLFKSNNQVGWLIFLGLVGGGLWIAAKPYF